MLHIFAGKVNGSPKENAKYFNTLSVEFEEKYAQFGERSIRYILSGDSSAKNVIVFVHGAPGSWNAFQEYMADSSLRSAAQLISIDRLGYGYSDYGQVEHNIDIHAQALNAVLSQNSFDSVVLVGHSYGGPIVANYAVEYPEKVKSILMIAPVIAPEAEREFWFNHILKLKLIRFLLPDYINVSVQEKLHHADALKEIEHTWRKLQAPIIHMHCDDDWIAPAAGNLEFSSQNIPKEYLTIETWEGAGHLIPFNSFDKVKHTILTLIKN